MIFKLLVLQPRKERLQPVSDLLAALLVKYPDLQQRAQRAFVTYLRSIHIQKDKEIFDVMKLPIDEYSASLGLPMTPKIRFLNQKIKSKAVSTQPVIAEPKDSNKEIELEALRKKLDHCGPEEEEAEKALLLPDNSSDEREGKASEILDVMYVPSYKISIGKEKEKFRLLCELLHYILPVK